MKLIFAVLYVSSTIGLTRYKMEDFLHLLSLLLLLLIKRKRQ